MPKHKDLLMTPSQIRNRLRRRVGRAEEELANLMEHDPRYKPLDQWDYEELCKGVPRNRKGNFQGQAYRPAWLTAPIQEEIRRRLRIKATADLSSHIKAAIEVMTRIMMDPDEKSSIRMDAAKFIIEQVLGKATQHMDIAVGDKVKDALASALVLEDGSPAHPVLELESSEYTVEEEDDDDD